MLKNRRLDHVFGTCFKTTFSKVNRRSQLSAHADDHQLYFSCSEPAIQEKKPTEKKTSEWYNENFLEGNLSKYQTMIIPKQESDFLDVVIDGMKDYHH